MEEPYTLLQAIEEGFVDGVRRLLLLGVSSIDKDCDPLEGAIQLGHREIVRLLLIAGSDPNTRSGSAMIAAARLNDPRMAEVLWLAGADITVMDNAPFRVAEAEGKKEMMTWLRHKEQLIRLQNDNTSEHGAIHNSCDLHRGKD